MTAKVMWEMVQKQDVFVLFCFVASHVAKPDKRIINYFPGRASGKSNHSP